MCVSKEEAKQDFQSGYRTFFFFFLGNMWADIFGSPHLSQASLL